MLSKTPAACHRRTPYRISCVYEQKCRERCQYPGESLRAGYVHGGYDCMHRSRNCVEIAWRERPEGCRITGKSNRNTLQMLHKSHLGGDRCGTRKKDAKGCQILCGGCQIRSHFSNRFPPTEACKKPHVFKTPSGARSCGFVTLLGGVLGAIWRTL